MSRSGAVARQYGMTEIVITGATGVIGRRAVRELLAAGHRVTGVTRSARGREQLASLGARAVEADVFDEASLRRAFDGADAVVNLLTHIPSIDRMADPFEPAGHCGPDLGRVFHQQDAQMSSRLRVRFASASCSITSHKSAEAHRRNFALQQGREGR